MPTVSSIPPPARPELLAPAGDFAAACAALHYGADAVYAGLRRFSARAEAVNLTPEDLRRLVAHAHALPRPRRVYVTLNTLILERELPAAIETLEELDDLGVDAAIVQDLGILRIARRCFPRLRLHASTQLAVHDLAGARALAGLGFRRIVLARELTLAEAARIGREAGIEVEVFVHGALCYSYSGLCLFSARQAGRSGNRGRCAYCCREPFATTAPHDRPTAPIAAFPFSMRDLALAPLTPELLAGGIASLKIEGRMKNACYVACVTDYYRRKLDGTLPPGEEAARVQDLQTIFSRPWTQLYAAGRETPAEKIIDATAVGHRGAPIGTADAVTRDTHGGRWLRFTTRRALEKHDGLQIDPPRGGKPFGFAVDALRRAGASRLEIAVPAGNAVEIRLPDDGEIPEITPGATVFCSASQAVRRHYQTTLPRPTDCRFARPVRVQATLRTDGLMLIATVLPEPPETSTRAGHREHQAVMSTQRMLPDTAGSPAAEQNPSVPSSPLSALCVPNAVISATVSTALSLSPARQPEQTAAALRRALDRSGDTPWQVATLELDDPQGLFVPVSALNEARRQLFDALRTQWDAARQARRTAACAVFGIEGRADDPVVPKPEAARWAVKVDLALPPVTALATADEIVLHLGHLAIDGVRAQLEAWLQLTPQARLRLALPAVTRQQEEEALRTTIAVLLADGWRQWECAGLGGWQLLRDATREPLHLTADWSLYGLNHAARGLLAELGMARAVAAPEDTEENIAAFASQEGPEVEVLAWQHTPLFLSETPPLVASERPPPWTLASRRGGRLVVNRLDNRWVTVAEEPFSQIDALPRLHRSGVRWFRTDFLWSPPNLPGLPCTRPAT